MQTWPTQARMIDTPATHTLLCGSRKSGKSYAQSMVFMRMMCEHWHTPIKGLIFDVEHPALDEVKAIGQEIFGDKGTYTRDKFRFANGSELLYRHAKNRKDCEKILGFNRQFIGINEVSKHEDDVIYNLMTATLKQKGDVMPKFVSTTNPYGRGKMWLKKRFIDVAKYETLVERQIKLFDGSYYPSTSIAYFSTFRDNPHVTPFDMAAIMEACKFDESLAKAWIDGSWDTVFGAALGKVWRPELHVVDRLMRIPEDWIINRSMDWGYDNPSAIIWFAEVTDDDHPIYPMGSVIAIDELVVSHYSPTQLAEAVVEREALLRTRKIVGANVPIWGAAADSQIYNDMTGDDSIADKMAEKGVHWEKADKRPGSRIAGKQLVIDRLANVLRKNKGPGLYFSEDCKLCIEQIPNIQHHETIPEDTQKGGDDHTWDALRYRLFTPPTSKSYNIPTEVLI